MDRFECAECGKALGPAELIGGAHVCAWKARIESLEKRVAELEAKCVTTDALEALVSSLVET